MQQESALSQAVPEFGQESVAQVNRGARKKLAAPKSGPPPVGETA
jgi:hypothetical protein